MKFATRYEDITSAFDSIVSDANSLLEHMADGRIQAKEKLERVWMKWTRGTPAERFDDIRTTYEAVARDTKTQIDKEQTILDAYNTFRLALQDAKIKSAELLATQTKKKNDADQFLGESQKTLDAFTGDDQAEKGRLQLARDQAKLQSQKEDRKYQFVLDLSQGLSIGYDVGDGLATKLRQTQEVKEQVYARAVTFFQTNSHVYTLLATLFTAQAGLHESSEALKAMKEGTEKAIRTAAQVGSVLEHKAIEIAYGNMLDADAVRELFESVVAYQVESRDRINVLREGTIANVVEVSRIAEDGRRRETEAVAKYNRELAA